MSDTVEAVASPTSRGRGRKVRAMLAGGLVLGVGAAITLAAWTDSEFATGTFTAGSFDLEGSTTAAAGPYADHNVEDDDAAAVLEFTLDLNENLTPDDVTYAPFWVRLAAGTTTAATLDLTEIVAADGDPVGNAENLSWTVVALTGPATCDAAGVAGGTVLGSGDTLETDAAVAGDDTQPLAIGAPTTDAGAPVPLCFAVTAGPDLEQTGSATATWQLLATSI